MSETKAKTKKKTAKPKCGHVNLHTSEEIKCTLLKGHKGKHEGAGSMWSDMAGKKVKDIEVKHAAYLDEEHEFPQPTDGPIASDQREPLGEGE